MKTALITLTATGLLLSACCTIKTPLSKNAKEYDASAKIAGDIITAQSKGELSGSYKQKIDQTFQSLSQENIALDLWLQAANCEMQRGHKEIAQQIYQYAMQRFRGSGAEIDLGKLGGANMLIAPMHGGRGHQMTAKEAVDLGQDILKTHKAIYGQ